MTQQRVHQALYIIVATICKLMVTKDNTSHAHNMQRSPDAPVNATQAISARTSGAATVLTVHVTLAVTLVTLATLVVCIE